MFGKACYSVCVYKSVSAVSVSVCSCGEGLTLQAQQSVAIPTGQQQCAAIPTGQKQRAVIVSVCSHSIRLEA